MNEQQFNSTELRRGEYAPTTQDWYEYSFDVLPPYFIRGGGFAVSEPLDHDWQTDEPIYFGYLEYAGRYYQAVGTLPELQSTFARIKTEVAA